MATRRKQSPLIWIIEAFSVLTAMAFVTSGAGNGYLFWSAWRVNYFLVASPSDVVMSGFVLLGVTVSLTISFLMILIAALWIEELIKTKMSFREGAQQFAETIQYAGHVVANQRAIFATGAGLTVAFAFLIFIVFVQLPSTLKRDGRFGYWTGLKLAPSAQADQDCRGAPILWMGSSAAIVGCQRGVRVFHKLDDIVTEPLGVKREPGEYLPPVQAPAPKAAISAPPCRDGKPECDPWERAWKAGETPPKGSVVARDGAITPPVKP